MFCIVSQDRHEHPRSARHANQRWREQSFQSESCQLGALTIGPSEFDVLVWISENRHRRWQADFARALKFRAVCRPVLGKDHAVERYLVQLLRLVRAGEADLKCNLPDRRLLGSEVQPNALNLFFSPSHQVNEHQACCVMCARNPFIDREVGIASASSETTGPHQIPNSLILLHNDVAMAGPAVAIICSPGSGLINQSYPQARKEVADSNLVAPRELLQLQRVTCAGCDGAKLRVNLPQNLKRRWGEHFDSIPQAKHGRCIANGTIAGHQPC